MATLTLVRHSQASFLSENYDRLSPLGEEQSRRLGEYWLARKVRFDVVFYGPRERQIRTGEIIADLYRRSGEPWPEPVIVDDFDEYPAEEVVTSCAPALAERYAEFREWAEAYQNGGEDTVRRRALDLLVRETTRKWLEGEVQAPEHAGTWASFLDRVHRGVHQVRRNTPKSGSCAVFTSGGPVAVTAGLAMDLSHGKIFDLVWATRNSAMAEYLFSGDRFSLSVFNATPHLEDSLLTYR